MYARALREHEISLVCEARGPTLSRLAGLQKGPLAWKPQTGWTASPRSVWSASRFPPTPLSTDSSVGPLIGAHHEEVIPRLRLVLAILALSSGPALRPVYELPSEAVT